MNTYVDFDTLLKIACDEYCRRDAEEFLAADTTGFETTARERRRFRRIMRCVEKGRDPRVQRLRISTGRIVAAACLVALVVSITACVAVPKVREAIKRAVVEFREKYMTVEFTEVSPEQTEGTLADNVVAGQASPETEAQTPTDSTAEITKPTTIEKKAYASNLPEGYTYKVDMDTITYYIATYYYADEAKFSISQNIITKHLFWTSSEDQKLTYTNVNGHEAILLESIVEPSMYLIVWQDSQYEYYLEGYFSNAEEVIEIANGIRLN